MIAYLQGKDTTVEVPDEIGNKELSDIQQNFDHYVQPEQSPQTTSSASPTSPEASKATIEVPKTPIPTGIPGVNVPQGTISPELPKWVPNFYEGYIKPSINALGPMGLPAQLESLPESQRGAAEAFTTSALKQITAGLAKPILSGIDSEEKDHPIASFGGALTGGLGGLLATGGALRIAGLGVVAEEAGKAGVEAGLASASRYLPRAIMTGATFGTQTFVAHTIKAFQDGNVDLAQFGKDVLLQTAGGATFGAIGGVANVPLSVASAGGLGFVMSKMEGGDNREATLNAGLFAGFEFIGSFGKNETLIKEGIKNIEYSIDDYVKAKDPNLSPKGGIGRAIVTLEAQKYGGIEELGKKENALQLIEDINQKIRQGKVPAPIQTLEPKPEVGLTPSEPSEQTSRLPTAPTPGLPQETGLAQAQTQGEVFPPTDVSSNPMIANHPDFVQLTKDSKAIVQKYADERNISPTNELAFSLYHELHDVLGRIRKADMADRPKVIEQIKAEYPDIEREFATLSSKVWTDQTEGYFNSSVAGKYGSMRPAVATNAEKAQQEALGSITKAIEEGKTPGEVFTKTTEAVQDVLPKEPKALKYDESGIPIRKPNSVVVTVPTPEGKMAKITHGMILDEAKGLLQQAADIHGTPHPLLEFVRNNGGIKGFKGGMEGEEFTKVPIHVRGVVSADEMAQMAYDRNLLEEPSADLLRNELAAIPAKGEKPKLANFYDQAQQDLEQYFSNLDLPMEMGKYNASEKTKWEYGAEPFAAIPGEAVASYGNKADIIYDEKDGQSLGYKAILSNGQIVNNPKSNKIGGSPYFETMDEAEKAVESYFREKPSIHKQQELDFGSPYEEDKRNQIPQEQGKAAPTQPTVRGGFRAIQEPHLEVEFKQNGFLVFANRKIQSPADLAYGFKFLHNEAQENFMLGAIKDNRIVAIEHLAVGTIDQVAVYPYETINLIDRQSADSFFVVHNHPSGHVVPSEEDKRLTESLKRVMANNGIEFKGHVIIDDTKFGFIDPEGNVSEQEHHVGGPAKTKKVPVLKKYFEWLRPKSSIGISLTSPTSAFEVFKGIQRGHDEGILYLMNIKNELLNAIVLPQKQFNAGTIQRLAASYRSLAVISVNSGLDNLGAQKLRASLRDSDIRYLDDIAFNESQAGYKSKLEQGVFEPQAKYSAQEEKQLFPVNKENVADRYERLRQEAIAQGFNPAQASKYAKDAMASNAPTPSGVKLKQKEFGTAGGVEGFGQGRQGEQSLFEPGNRYGEKEISQQMKDSATEIKTLVNPSAAAPLASQITREQLGKMARSYDKAEAALEAAKKMFDKQTAEQNTEFIDKMEKGLIQTTPALEKIAKQLRILLDEKRTEIRALGTGKLETFIENYFPHIWDQGEKAVSKAVMKAAKRPFEGSKSFLKKRTLEYFKQGIEIGLTPVSFNPVENVLLKMREMDKYLMSHRTLNGYKDVGLAQAVKGFGRPEGKPDWIKIDDRISTIMYKNEAGEMVISGHYWAQPDAARIINNYLSPGLQKSEIYKAFRYAGNLLNQFQLGFSAFHLGFTSMDAIVSKSALALNQLFSGHPLKAIEAALTSPFAPVTNIIRGNKLFKAWRGEGRSSMDEVMAEAMASGGGRARMDQFYATKAADQLKKYFQAGKPIRGILHLPLVIAEASSKPILEYIVPRQKLGVFADIMKMEMENNPNMTHEEMRTIAQKAWDSVDNRMGQLVYDNLFWNRTFKDLLMASVRSVGWNLGTIREIGGGGIDAAKMLGNLARGKKSDLSYRTAYLMALPFVAGLFGAIYQYLRTGKGPEDLKDYYFPRTGGVDANGNENRVSPPTYMKDIYHYTTAPIKTIANKLNPLLAITAQMLSNKDYFGVKIRNEDDPITKQALSDAIFILKQMEPFGFRNMRKQQQTGNRSLVDTIQPWIGITPAPYDINQTKAERLAHEISASHQAIGGRTQAQADTSRLLGDLRRRYKAGDETVQQDLINAYQKGQISKNQMRDVILHSNMTPLQRMVQHFSLEETERVYDKANDEEKAQIQRQLDRKRFNARQPVETQ